MLNHSGTSTLETPRLTLRRFRQGDAEDMYRNWASSENVTRHLTWMPHESVEVTKRSVAHWITCYENADNYHWGIELKEIGQVIGSISIVDIGAQLESAEIGYCIGEAYWGRGLMPEALAAVIAHCFGRVGFHRVTASCSALNPASGRVMEKCGMKYEGTLRDGAKNNRGEYIDYVKYGILISDYNEDKNQ